MRGLGFYTLYFSISLQVIIETQLQFSIQCFLQLFQNLGLNLISLSDIILYKIPCRLTILSIYNSANLCKGWMILIDKKWVDLVSLSIITQIESHSFVVFGKLVTKSMEIISHFHSGILNGCIRPNDLWCSIFDSWQVKQAYRNSTTSLFIHGN